MLAILAALQTAPTLSLIPKPQSVVVDPGRFEITKDCRISVPSGQEALGKRLQDYLRPATGFKFNVARSGGAGAINLRLDSHLKELGPEGYRLQVKDDRIDIAAYQPAGIFYGIQTLRELLPPEILRPSQVSGVAWVLPCVHISDVPRFAWRGALMDVARHFEQKSFVEKFLDEMALHKLNKFHWHLTDDNGWRVEIKHFPLLTKLSSNTDFSQMNPRGATRSISVLPGGYYTQEDIREIVRYAQDRFITVVPEIEMPGHAMAAIKAYPDLGNKLEIAAGGGDPSFVGGDNVYNVDDSTVSFLQTVLTEIMDLFPSPYIHVGGDEVWKEPWKHNPQAQQRMKTLGLKNEDELESWFIKQMDAFLTSKGRHLIGWDEILEGGLAPGAAVMSWRGIDGGIAAAKSGHDVVMAPTDWTYFDYYQSNDPKSEPLAIGGYVPIQKIYGYEPVPSALTPEEAKHVLGVQGQLWSEYISSPQHMEYMAWPRLCALSEVGWSQPQGRNYQEFLSRLLPHLDRLRAMDVAFRELRPADLLPEAPAGKP
ncbi:MAG TPA: beta-N-acetylhexosaminidase [Fimbriimonas sp.]|nr:beta-N-acetylhexosaminidase [Fimbriimonas sp.]